MAGVVGMVNQLMQGDWTLVGLPRRIKVYSERTNWRGLGRCRGVLAGRIALLREREDKSYQEKQSRPCVACTPKSKFAQDAPSRHTYDGALLAA